MEDEKIFKVNRETFSVPILEHYKPYFDACFIVLHPFYSKVFHDNYEPLYEYKLTYPLIEKISWAEIIKRAEIVDFKKLALAITYSACNSHYQESVEKEYQRLDSLYKIIDIVEPYWEQDRIPEDIIVEFVNFLSKLNYKEVLIGEHLTPGVDLKVELVNIENEKIFDFIGYGKPKTILYTNDKKYCLVLPYHDLPFAFLLTNNIDKQLLEKGLSFEGFFADNNTQTYWHLER